MGRKKRLNKLLTRWMKSDLPEESSTVLLLGVTRIPTSPPPARRPCSLALTTPNFAHSYPLTTGRVKRHSSYDDAGNRHDSSALAEQTPPPTSSYNSSSSNNTTPSHNSYNTSISPAMDRSVDSIGTCSLDVEASADLSDWSENSSVGTLRSVSIKSPLATPKESRLPSYLSLACTVNGYSTTTNYDRERLARSRDTSPHRLPEHTHDSLTYAIHNNLLSPPNLVPLPMQKFTNTMASDRTIKSTHHHQEFYTSSKTITQKYISKESRNFTSSIFGNKDTVDACLEPKYRSNGKSLETKNMTNSSLVHGKIITTESVHHQEYKNCLESNKSFIQQRVERLYGPGALAQGFFVMKRQKNRFSESDKSGTNKHETSYEDKHSISLSDKLLEETTEGSMKQSTSSPALPVMRHLRPEFRAQLPALSPRKEAPSQMQKSNTVPELKEEIRTNGVAKLDHSVQNGSSKVNGHVEETCKMNGNDAHSEIKDGTYFIKVMDVQAARLLIMADKVEKELEESEHLSEDAKGFLRSASGKARLLVAQKMQQFKGLCTNNITQVEGAAFPTTNEDLQGFWDMVMLQVDQIDALYEELDILRENNWEEQILLQKKQSADAVDKAKSSTNGTSRARKIVPKVASAGAEQARIKREAQRKQMMEDRRKAMREKKSPQQNVEIFVPESS